MLRQREFCEWFSVVGESGGLGAIGSLTKRHYVDVKLQDLVFGQFLLDLQGQQHFFELADEGTFETERHVARQLHGDGAGARGVFCAQQQFGGVVDQRNEVDAAMRVKTLVLRIQQRINELLRYFVETKRYQAPFPEFCDQLLVSRVDS